MEQGQARALLAALNELFCVSWSMEQAGAFAAYTLSIDLPGRAPFTYRRTIQPRHIDGQPFRTALKFADEVCERFGREMLLRGEKA